VRQAFEKGAKGILVRKDRADEFNGSEAAALIPVDDVKMSLTETARIYRQMLKAKVVGVTGSAGKTTVKEFTAAFLGTKGKTHATAGNYNNDLGLPITILECPPDADFLVLEMGTNHPGEIAHLVDIGKPDVGIISSIGTAHIEFFKTQDGIAEEKGTLFSFLPEEGFAVLGRNNDRFEMLKEMCRCRTVISDGTAPFACPLPGDYNRWNMSLAWNCAKIFGVTEDMAQSTLEGFVLPGDRWRKSERNGVAFISDCYNANPTSMIVALETFAAEPCEGRRIAVLGDMFELGEASARLHGEVKTKALGLELDKVIFVGENFGGVSFEDAKAELFAYVKPGDSVLLKASHGMALGRMLEP
jgi:UDP-N-acetylmuramoyl-tripeptide--D-alanyl-D-alanine ligase